MILRGILIAGAVGSEAVLGLRAGKRGRGVLGGGIVGSMDSLDFKAAVEVDSEEGSPLVVLGLSRAGDDGGDREDISSTQS